MAENYVPNLGRLCGDDARRDAVHVAVAPVVAGMDLLPGAHVGLTQDMQAVLGPRAACGTDAVGIVDPFLHSPVKKGERFWLVLYPGTITGLRHVWTHPAFKARIPGGA